VISAELEDVLKMVLVRLQVLGENKYVIQVYETER